MPDDQPTEPPKGELVPATKPVLEAPRRNTTRAPMRPGLRPAPPRRSNYFTKIRIR